MASAADQGNTTARAAQVAEGNGVLFQYFYWDLPADGGLWRQLAVDAVDLAAAGVTAVWLPPPYKGDAGAADVGYGVYDTYDLGEFDQKGSVRTKYGTKAELVSAVSAAHDAGVQVYADVVLNHRVGADGTEEVTATPYAANDRSKPSGPPRRIRAYTRFTFPGRRGKYSAYEWDRGSFDAVDYDANLGGAGGTVYLLEGKSFDKYTSLERGNYDYLLGADTDTDAEWVRRELADWGRWLFRTVGFDGARLDAVKHMDARFFRDSWLPAVREVRPDAFAVGEYWENNVQSLQAYINNTAGSMSLMDVPLHYHMHEASLNGNAYDMTRIFEGTLVATTPTLAVTFVDNHDTLLFHGLASPVADWFKPLAYALVLLRRGGYPAVFHADYYGGITRNGATQQVITLPSHRQVIDVLLRLRRDHAYGEEVDFFGGGSRQLIGWTRAGRGKALAVVLSSGPGGARRMRVAAGGGARFVDALGHVKGEVTTDGGGWADFSCAGGSVSAWLQV